MSANVYFCGKCECNVAMQRRYSHLQTLKCDSLMSIKVKIPLKILEMHNFHKKMQLKFYVLCCYITFNCVFCDNYENVIISAIIQHYLTPVTYTVHVSSKMCMDATDSKSWVPCDLSISLFFIYSNSTCKTMWPWTSVEPCACISWDRQSMILYFTKI